MLCAALLVLLSGPVAAQNGDILPRDLEDLEVNDTTVLTATIVNPLPATDDIVFTLHGDALVDGLVTVRIDDDPGHVHACNPSYTECNVDVEADSQENVNITVEATAIGQGTLEGTVNSSRTDLTNHDEIMVRVGMGFPGVDVSAPGISHLHVMLIALLAGLFIFAGGRRTT